MRCNIELLDSNHNAWFTGTRDLPADYMLKLAAERKPAVMAQGLEFAQNAIPFFGGQLVKVVKAGGSEDQMCNSTRVVAAAGCSCGCGDA